MDSTIYNLMINDISTRVEMGGFAKLSTVIKNERDKNTFILNSGELNGTLHYSSYKGVGDFVHATLSIQVPLEPFHIRQAYVMM